MKRCDVQGGCWLKFTLSTTFAAATAAAARFDCFLFAGTGADDELLDDWKKLDFVIFDFLNYLDYKINKARTGPRSAAAPWPRGLGYRVEFAYTWP